jgi:hypothetical protein
LDKLNVLRADPRLGFLMRDEGKLDLAGVIAQFVGDVSTEASRDVRIIDISGLPNEVAGPLTATIARLLFQYKVWQTREERERDPVLFVCEEAHGMCLIMAPLSMMLHSRPYEGLPEKAAIWLRPYVSFSATCDVEAPFSHNATLGLCFDSRIRVIRSMLHVSFGWTHGLTRLLPSLVRREAILW